MHKSTKTLSQNPQILSPVAQRLNPSLAQSLNPQPKNPVVQAMWELKPYRACSTQTLNPRP